MKAYLHTNNSWTILKDVEIFIKFGMKWLNY